MDKPFSKLFTPLSDPDFENVEVVPVGGWPTYYFGWDADWMKSMSSLLPPDEEL